MFYVQLTVGHTGHPAFTGKLLMCVLKGLLDHLRHFCFFTTTVKLYHIINL